MSDCSKHHDEYPGMVRLKVYFTDPSERVFDWPFVSLDREVARVTIGDTEYVDAPRLLEANGRLCAEVNKLEAAMNAAAGKWAEADAENRKQRERIEELEEELADEKSENGWAREFLNTIGPRCGKPDCRSLVDYVSQLEQLVKDMRRDLAAVYDIAGIETELPTPFDKRIEKLGIEV